MVEMTEGNPVGEVAIPVGMQGAGKTYDWETVLSNHERISQDEGPRNYRGIVLRLEELLRDGTPRIAIDQTNPMRYQRQEFAALAHAAKKSRSGSGMVLAQDKRQPRHIIPRVF
jgi:hypothetical protein